MLFNLKQYCTLQKRDTREKGIYLPSKLTIDLTKEELEIHIYRKKKGEKSEIPECELQKHGEHSSRPGKHYKQTS